MGRQHLLVGCYSNSPHQLEWVITDRGKVLLYFILPNQLQIVNVCSKAAYVIRQRREVKHVTFSTENTFHLVRDFYLRLSDYRYIQF